MMLKDSKFRFATNLDPKKRILLSIVDLLGVFLLSLIAFPIIERAMYSNKDSEINKTNEEIKTAQNDLYQMTYASKVAFFDNKTNKMADSAKIDEVYLLSQVKTSLNGEVTNPNKYNDIHISGELSYETDYIGNYFCIFKAENIDKFKVNENFGKQYYVDIINQNLNYNSVDYIEINGENYPKLRQKYATAIDKFLCLDQEVSEIEGEQINGKEVYVALYRNYKEIIEIARNDFAGNYNPYISLNAQFKKLSNKLIGFKIMEALISYTISSIILFLILPLVLKGNTISLVLVGGTTVSKDGYNPRWWQIILKFLGYFVINFISIALVFALIYGKNASHFYLFNIFGCIPFFALYIIGLVSFIFNLVLPFINKNSKRDLLDIISYQTTKKRE